MCYFNIRFLLRNKMLISKSLLKHGHSSFSLEILEYCEPSLVITREQYYLDLLKPEYNILKFAGSSLGFKHSLEAKAKIRAKALTSERLEQFLERLNRLNANSEFKAKRLEGLKRLHSRPEYQAKRLGHLKRLHANPEYRAKNLEHLKRLHANPEYQAKRLEHLKRQHANPEIKAKNLEQLKVINADPEYQAKRLEHLKRLNASAEHKEHLNRLHSIQSHQVSVLDTLTNETIVYSSISEAARGIGVAPQSISGAFKLKPGESTVLIKKKRYQITKLATG